VSGWEAAAWWLFAAACVLLAVIGLLAMCLRDEQARTRMVRQQHLATRRDLGKAYAEARLARIQVETLCNHYPGAAVVVAGSDLDLTDEARAELDERFGAAVDGLDLEVEP
jgi:hypothetical protein